MAKTNTTEEFHSRYDHLNEDDHSQLEITLPIDQLAELIVRLNYGEIRLLAAIVRARKRLYKKKGWNFPDSLSNGIMDLLNKGYS